MASFQLSASRPGFVPSSLKGHISLYREVLVWDIIICHDQPIVTISWCLKAEAKAAECKSSSCELVAALCSMFDLWEWVTNEDTPHRQVSFHWPQGRIGAKCLPCSSSFGKIKQLMPENSSFSVASFSNANTYFCFIWKAKEAPLLASLQHFCLQPAFPSPMKSQDICLLLSKWAKKSK